VEIANCAIERPFATAIVLTATHILLSQTASVMSLLSQNRPILRRADLRSLHTRAAPPSARERAISLDRAAEGAARKAATGQTASGIWQQHAHVSQGRTDAAVALLSKAGPVLG
jgi:hypothetical protein